MEAGAAAERAAELKISKYSGLDDKCVFQSIAVESLAWSAQRDSLSVLKDLGRRISAQSGDERERERESAFLYQRLSIVVQAIQRYLAAQQFWGGRPPGLMVIPAFTVS